jgi:hypothetical protein
LALRLSKRLYRQRNLDERFFNKLKHYRAVATRYDTRDDNFRSGLNLASIRIWLRLNFPRLKWFRAAPILIGAFR